MKIKTLEIRGFEPAIRAMRLPMKSGEKSDSGRCEEDESTYIIGPNDLKLAQSLVKAGQDHSKFLRQIVVWAEIEAPRYFWTEFDTYGRGVEKVSESTMHTILKDEFDESCFEKGTDPEIIRVFKEVVENSKYLLPSDRKLLIKKCLPESFLQTRGVMISYAMLRHMYHQRKNHQLPEWRITFCQWIKTLPYAELITGEDK